MDNDAIVMTEGSYRSQIIKFAIPLFLGNLFQQMYSAADSLVVGNVIGSNALAAVSSSGSLIMLLIGLFQGLAMGAGVVIAQCYLWLFVDNHWCSVDSTNSDINGNAKKHYA